VRFVTVHVISVVEMKCGGHVALLLQAAAMDQDILAVHLLVSRCYGTGHAQTGCGERVQAVGERLIIKKVGLAAHISYVTTALVVINIIV